MTTDNQKKYEEAAREWADNEGQALYDKGRLPRELVHESWIAGASFAEKEEWIEIAEEKDATIKQLKEENQRLKSSMKTLLQAWQRGDSYEFYEDLIEKHKLIEP